MDRGEQIDKMSRQYVCLSPREIKYAKKVHKRAMRRLSKDVNNPNPKWNRYDGWIG